MTVITTIRSIASIEEAGESDAARSPEQLEELEQVARSIDGDAFAFAELYDRHVVRVYRHAYYVVNDRNVAEDLTAQTFLKAWQAIGRFNIGGAPFIAWLLPIAHNVCISYLRSKRDHSELEDTHVDEKRHGNPEAALELAEDQKAVREAI